MIRSIVQIGQEQGAFVALDYKKLLGLRAVRLEIGRDGISVYRNAWGLRTTDRPPPRNPNVLEGYTQEQWM